MTDTFSRNQLSQATIKLLYFEPLYCGHLFIADNFLRINGVRYLKVSLYFLSIKILMFLFFIFKKCIDLSSTFVQNGQWKLWHDL